MLVRIGLGVVAALVLAAAAFLAVRGLPVGGRDVTITGAPGTEPAFEVGQAATVRGVVVENTIDPCLSPGPTPCVEDAGFALRLDADSRPVSVWYHLGMGEPCDNAEAGEQGSATRAGTTVEVRAEVESVGDRVSLTTCNSPEHYIREIE